MISFSGSDLILVSVTFGFLATLIWAKGFVFKNKNATLYEAATYFNFNPFSIKSAIIQQVMVPISLVSGALCAILAILGTYISTGNVSKSSLFMSSNEHLALFLILSLVFIFIVCKIANLMARAQYVPILKEKMKEGFEDALFMYQNDGLQKYHFEKKVELTREQKDNNLEESRDRFKRLALLFDIYLKKNDDYEKIINRLKKQFK